MKEDWLHWTPDQYFLVSWLINSDRITWDVTFLPNEATIFPYGKTV